MSSSSSVQFYSNSLCYQVDNIAKNEVTPTRQAKGDSGKEPKLHRRQKQKRKPEGQVSSG